MDGWTALFHLRLIKGEWFVLLFTWNGCKRRKECDGWMDSPISPQINKKVNDLSFYLPELALKEEKNVTDGWTALFHLRLNGFEPTNMMDGQTDRRMDWCTQPLTLLLILNNLLFILNGLKEKTWRTDGRTDARTIIYRSQIWEKSIFPK